MSIYLVRHSKAGERAAWSGDDASRPLSGRGRRQSEAIADRMEHENLTRLVSSPARRCIETLEPLAARVGLPIEADERLTEGAAVEDTLALIDELPEGGVMSTHGDVVEQTIPALERRGMKLLGVPDWRKGAMWVIDTDAEGIRQAYAVPPPDRDPL